MSLLEDLSNSNNVDSDHVNDNSDDPPAYESGDDESDEKNSEYQKRIDKIVNALLTGTNVFLSGSGGTGKSYMLKKVYLQLQEKGCVVYKTGSTGVSAESIGGMTLHSWAGVMLGNKTAETYYITIQERNKKAWKRWTTASVLIIDEISMTGGNFFQMLSDLGKLIRKNKKPFGGITVLICGDVCQLPPVKDKYFFQTEAYEQLVFKPVRLTHPWRFQNDIEFFYLLSRVRLGAQTNDDIQLLRNRMNAYYKEIAGKKYKPDELRPTQMFSRRIDVTEMNLSELNKLPGEVYQYACTDSLVKKNKTSTATLANFQDAMDKSVPSEMLLKVGAQVMLTWNLDVEGGLCNGSRGVVLECLEDSVLVRFRNGQEHMILPNVWEFETEDECFHRCQIPLILAWSTTIHRSQSSTLDYVIIDLGTTIFSDNMAYVALSRCRSLEGVYIVNLLPEKIKCDPTALSFEHELIELEKDTKW